MTSLAQKYGNKNKVAGYKNSVKTLQEGGQMAAPAPAPEQAPQGGGGGDIMGMLEQYAQSRDPQLAVAIADTMLEMMAQEQAAAQGGAPAAPQGDVGMARVGGTLPTAKRIFRK